jgi:hypothetical protein
MKGERAMDLQVFENMDAQQLRRYLEFLLWHYRVVDAFWFIYVGERFDQSTAERSMSSLVEGRRNGG